jgi:hypothetical protein
MVPSFCSPAVLILLIAGLEEAKTLAGEVPPPDSRSALATPSLQKSRRAVKEEM